MKKTDIEIIKENILDELDDFDIIVDDVTETSTSISHKTYELSVGNKKIVVNRAIEYDSEDGFIRDDIEIEESEKLSDEQKDKIIDFIGEQE